MAINRHPITLAINVPVGNQGAKNLPLSEDNLNRSKAPNAPIKIPKEYDSLYQYPTDKAHVRTRSEMRAPIPTKVQKSSKARAFRYVRNLENLGTM